MGGSIIVAGLAGNATTGMVTGLTNYGYTVFAAENGDDASGLVKTKGGLKAIVINASLKGLSTLDLCKQIKLAGKHLKVPVIILEDEKVDHKLFKEIGITEFYPSPCSTTTVARAIKSLSGEDGPFTNGPPNLAKEFMIAAAMLVVGFGLLTYFIFIPLLFGGAPVIPMP